ncbi:hypothetical protein QE450_001097 [Paenibacillus sp. SORGH_AS306]|nr:hypothetical protein [Paenibacillus sp. SORGH_AS_0306]MDR6110641.1 hypothetical protein [Paenibacillus sp. SORGH_AS_0338]
MYDLASTSGLVIYTLADDPIFVSVEEMDRDEN